VAAAGGAGTAVDRSLRGAEMSAFERHAVQRLLDQAAALGVDTTGLNLSTVFHDEGSYAARRWVEDHPDDEGAGCCWGSVLDPRRCSCWTPIFEVGQQPPRPPTCAEELKARPAMCGDCAFRPGSPERADEWTADALYDSARTGVPFWCHDGMRRPARWVHPDGRTVEGSPDDWQPTKVGNIPYRADGSPGLLCAGWAAVAAKA
jgi:hypothetical protein